MADMWAKVLSLTYLDNKNQFSSPRDLFDSTVLFCLKSGAFRYKIGDGEWHTAQKNAIVLCPAGVPFLKEATEPVSLLMAKLDVAVEFPLPQEPFYSATGRVQENIDALTGDGFIFTQEPSHRLCHYVLDLWCLATENLGAKKTPLQEAYNYICTHFCQDISINDMAQHYGYTTPRLIALFNKHYGAPPKNIILRHRITKAQELLLQTDLPVGEISLACGYEDTLYFSRVFSKYCGCSPSQFRKQEAI